MGRMVVFVLFCAAGLPATMCAQNLVSDAAIIFSTDKGMLIRDTGSLFTIRDIVINGNERTKNSIILRELPFGVDEAHPLDFITSKFYETQQRLMNTGLFRSVVVSLNSISGKDVLVRIDVEEKWYLYPLPFVRVVEGKFGKWWNEKGRDLNQLNYGIRFTQNNATGRNDRIQLHVMNGYTKQLSLDYSGLYLDKDLKWYTNLALAYGKNREINYVTQNNKLVPFKNPSGYIRTFSRATLDLAYRPAIKTRHTFSVGYFTDRIADTVYKLNRNFSNAPLQRFVTVGYNLSYTDLDFIPYPTKGVLGDFTFSKVGFTPTMNLWQLSAKTSLFKPVGKSFFNLKLAGMVKLPFRQPFSQQDFIGRSDMFLQGYEDYIIDGVAGGYTKLAFVHPVINTAIKVPNIAITKKLRIINPVPLKVYAKAFTNVGYVHNPNVTPANDLNNKMLYSGGFGLDIVAFTDLVVKLEWSFNQLGQNGLYLHQRERY